MPPACTAEFHVGSYARDAPQKMSAEHTGHQHTAARAEAETKRGRFRARQAADVMVGPHLARLRF